MSEKKTVPMQDTTTFDLEVGFKDENGVVHKEVEIREITGFDEEQMSKAEVRQNVGKLITALLSSVTVRIGELTLKDLGKTKWEKIFRELPMGDRDKLMKEIRKFTNGDEIEIDTKCASCKSKIKHIIEIDVDIEDRPLNVDPESIPFVLPKGIKDKEGKVYKHGSMRLVNGEDQEQLDSIARKNPGQANTQMIARAIKEIDGFGKVGLSDVRNMSVRDRDYLIKLMAESAYGPKFEISFSCPNCGEDIETGVHPVNFL